MFPGGATLLRLAVVGSLLGGGARAEETSETSFRPLDYIQTEVAANLDFSCVVGPFAAQGFSSGSNGYQGLNPPKAGRDRPNYAVYLDLQADVVPRLQLGTALRYEVFYSDFGTTLNGKLALWRATDRVNPRSAVSSGFRAPPPGQANLRAVTTGLSGTGGLTEAPRREAETLGPESTPWDCSGPFWYSRLFLDS